VQPQRFPVQTPRSMQGELGGAPSMHPAMLPLMAQMMGLQGALARVYQG